MTALFFQGLIVLLVFSTARRTVRRRWVRLRVNPFAAHTETLFLRRKPMTRLAALMLVSGLAMNAWNLQEAQTGSTTDFALPFLAVLTYSMVHFYAVLLVWNIYKRLINRGLMNDLKLTPTTLQEVLLPAFYRLTALFSVWYFGLELAATSLRGHLHFLPLLLASAICAAWVQWAFLFCAFNHGLGLVRVAALGLLLLSLLQLLMAPLTMTAVDSAFVGPVIWSLQTVMFLLIGNLFFVSFLRTDSAARADDPQEGKTRLYF